MVILEPYLQDLGKIRAQVEATPELSLREPLLVLVRELAKEAGRGSLLVAPEADAEQAGQPDIFVKDGSRLVGFIETKPPGADLTGWLKSSDQARRYRESLPNWIVTDYYRFLSIREGETVDDVAIAPPLDASLESEASERLLAVFVAFFAYAPPAIRSPQRLALELARRARLLRDGIRGALDAEGPDGQLRGVLDFYRETLMSDLDEDGFADTFAQTIAYGLFLARLREKGGLSDLSRATEALPQSVPFLRSAVRLLTEPDVLPGAITNLLGDLIALLDNTQIDAIRAEIAAGGLERDLVIYFYERFLEQYDAGERKRRGVYYTPPELVGYLIRAVQTLLERDFDFEGGLADDLVTVLDPAAGTGTFILGAAEEALASAASKGTAAQSKLIRSHLLPGFYGFELLPAPYAIAHLKLTSFFASRGYQLGTDERVRVYLTNTLEPHEMEEGTQLSFLPMLRGIVEEAKSAGHVKHRVPVLVILGNPPYERTSHNANEHSDRLLEDFYRLDGERLPDRNTAPLRDDYLRFIRWSVWKLLEQEGAPGAGVLAFVTNRAYLERKLHRAARLFLLRSFDDVYTFDLHGDQREWFADRVDEKVFKQVQAGIALTVFVKHSIRQGGGPLARVRYRDTFGRREEKLNACRTASLDDGDWVTLEPRGPLWLFVPYDVSPEYETWPLVTELFPVNVVGFQTHRDQLTVAFSEDELRQRLNRFADLAVPDTEWLEHGVRSGADFDLKLARGELHAEGPRRVMRMTYRGLEARWIAFDERLVDRPRMSVSRHLLAEPTNLALAFATGSLADGPYVIASRTPVPAAVLSWRTFGAAYFAPLWLHDDAGRMPNLTNGLLERLAQSGNDVGAEGFFHYVYAVLNSREYRSQYADALRYDFARVPIARDPTVFTKLTETGARLAAIHLLEDVHLEQAAPVIDGDDRAELARPIYDETSRTIQIAPNLIARDIAPEMWAYQQGAYRIVRDFLEARVGRRLTSEEFEDFRKLVAAVRLTLQELSAIDELVAHASKDAFRGPDLLS